jgi:nitronate monooxygenase
MLNTLKYPIILAPMGAISGGLLAQAVSDAGGLGLIGGGYCNEAWIERELELVRPNTVGIGFITWALAKKPHVLDMAIRHRPKAIMLSFGDIAPFANTIKKAGITLICQVQTLAQARDVYKKGADIIVVQGTESGGHGASRGLFSLLPAVADAVVGVPIVAAGGIADKRGVKAAQALGAQGVLLGTRFYACKESLASDEAKQKILAAKGDDTLRTCVFDYVRGYDWPAMYTARAIENDFSKKWHEQVGAKQMIDDTQKAAYQRASDHKNFDTAAIFAGECVDLIHDVPTAAKIVVACCG